MVFISDQEPLLELRNKMPNDRMKFSTEWHFFLPTLQNTIKKFAKKFAIGKYVVQPKEKILYISYKKSKVKVLFIIVAGFSENTELRKLSLVSTK